MQAKQQGRDPAEVGALWGCFVASLALALISLLSLFTPNVGFAQATPLLVVGLLHFCVVHPAHPVPKFRVSLVLGMQEFTTQFVFYFNTADWYLNHFISLGTIIVSVFTIFWVLYTQHGRASLDAPFLFSLLGFSLILVSDGLTVGLLLAPSPGSLLAGYFYGRALLYLETPSPHKLLPLLLVFLIPTLVAAVVMGALQDFLGLGLLLSLSLVWAAPLAYRALVVGRCIEFM